MLLSNFRRVPAGNFTSGMARYKATVSLMVSITQSQVLHLRMWASTSARREGDNSPLIYSLNCLKMFPHGDLARGVRFFA